MQKEIMLMVNDKEYHLSVEPRKTLLELLRNELRLTGVKEGCGLGECGACTVLLDGKPVNSCLTLAVDAHEKKITTIEGVADEGSLSPVQESFLRHGAIQCGFCTPGMVLTAIALLERNPTPSREEIRMAISGNLCRCTGYEQIVEAIQNVEKLGGER